MPSTTFNYGNWQFWAPYDSVNNYFGSQKVVFDGPNKLILISEPEIGINFRDDVYEAWKEWKHDPTQNNEKWEQAISVLGGDPLPGDRLLGTTFFLENGWRMRTWEGNHELTVTGNFFTREGVPAFVNTLNPWTITINLNTSTLVETLVTNQGVVTAGDINAIIEGVWNTIVQDSSTALDILNAIPDNVWDEIIDPDKNYTAREKLKRIATKTEDIALN
jgi:hypothetical protein